MYLPSLLIACLLFVFLLTAVGLLASHSLTEQLIRRGLLPQVFRDLIPVFLLSARAIAVVFILLGLGRAAVMAGIFSGEWVARYGLALILVVLGLILFWATFQERKSS